MVGLRAGMQGVTIPVFIEKGVKINTDVHVNTALKSNYFPEVSAVAGKNWSFRQDGAPSHRSNVTHAYLKNNTPAYIKSWPPRSPDLNPLDYSIWSILAADVNAQAPNDYNDLRAAVTRAVRNIDLGVVKKACAEFKPRLELRGSEDGGHFEHLLKSNKRN